MDKSNGGMGGKTILITGGTSGIGKATVALAAMGANVVIVGHNQERGEAVVEEIRARSHNESVELMLADLSVKAEVRGLAEEFQERHDRLDVLANNAGRVKCFSDRKEIKAKKIAYNPAARRKLWEVSEELKGLQVAA